MDGTSLNLGYTELQCSVKNGHSASGLFAVCRNTHQRIKQLNKKCHHLYSAKGPGNSKSGKVRQSPAKSGKVRIVKNEVYQSICKLNVDYFCFRFQEFLYNLKTKGFCFFMSEFIEHYLMGN